MSAWDGLKVEERTVGGRLWRKVDQLSKGGGVDCGTEKGAW